MPIPRLTRRNTLIGLGFTGVLGVAASSARTLISRVQVEDHRPAQGTADRDAIMAAVAQAARNGGGEIHFAPGRIYDLGEAVPDQSLITLKDLRGISFVGHGASLVCATRGQGKCQLFLAQRCHDLSFRDLLASDRGSDTRREWQGMDFLHCDTTAGPLGRVSLSSVRVDGAVSVLAVTGDPKSPRARDFLLDDVTARNCYYGVSFQENGDHLRGQLTASNCRRAYVAYGVRDHAVSLAIDHDATLPGGDAAVLIKRYRSDTGDIAVNARFSGFLAWRNLAKIEQQPSSGQSGTIENIALRFHVDADASNPRDCAGLGISAYRWGRQMQRTADIWRNITLIGCLGPLRTATRYYTRSSVAPDRVVESLGQCA